MSCCRKNGVLLGIALAWLTGCITIDPEEMAGGSTQYHIGIVKMTKPETDSRITAIRVETLGIAVANSLTIGWRDSESVRIPLEDAGGTGAPLKATCAIVIIARTPSEAEHAKQIVKSLEGEDVCVATF